MSVLKSPKQSGFQCTPLHKSKEPHPVYFLSQRSSFWIATLSVLAFLVGNMMGQNGWYMFWASVLGKGAGPHIEYQGTMHPIAQLPDPSRWAYYGGSGQKHLFAQAPGSVLATAPVYDPIALRSGQANDFAKTIYTVVHGGGYTSHFGSHNGVDIAAPKGTPVVAALAGEVLAIKSGGGFGNQIIIRSPNVPHPDSPSVRTELRATYAHLDSVLVRRGQVVRLGEQIGTVGETGYAYGPHLHFQIDKQSAPFDGYWPFNTADMNAAGFSFAQAVEQGLNRTNLERYTTDPMLYVQANYKAPTTVVASRAAAPEQRVSSVGTVSSRRAARLSRRGLSVTDIPSRLATGVLEVVTNLPETKPEVVPRMSPSQRATIARKTRIEERESRRRTLLRQLRHVVDNAPVVPDEPVNVVVQTTEVAATTEQAGLSPERKVHKLGFHHDGQFTGRGWEKVIITLLDEDGTTIQNPNWEKDIHLRTAYGKADFRPSVITKQEWYSKQKDGEYTAYFLPRGRSTIVISGKPYNSYSGPSKYAK